MNDLRLQLRRLEFPACAEECLKNIDTAILEKSSRSAYRTQYRELQKCIDEYLFCSTDRHGVLNPAERRLTALQQLQLSYMLCTYWSSKASNDSRTRYQRFDCIFCYREGDSDLHNARMATLKHVASLAIQIGCSPLLVDIGQWLSKAGITRNASGLQLCMYLISDLAQPILYQSYLIPLGFENELNLTGSDSTAATGQRDAARSGVQLSSEGCPTLAAVILIATFLELDIFVLPYNRLMLVVVADWITNNPKALLRAYKKATSSSMIKALCGTIDKMLCLCIDSCLQTAIQSSTSLSVLDSVTGVSLLDTFAKLHAGVLQFMILAAGSLDSRSEMCQSRHLADCLARYHRKSRELPLESEEVQLFLDRLSQTLQVAVAMKTLYGSVEEVQMAAEYAHVEHILLDHIFKTHR